MGKKFQKITVAKSNEVSLCPTFNSGANLKTEFEIVKDKEGATKEVEPILEGIKKYGDYYCFCCGEELGDAEQAFLHYLSEWAEDRMNDAIYWLLKDDLDEVMYQIKWSELSKEEKTAEYAKLFKAFLSKFQELPITKNKEGKYEVSLVSKSHIQEQDTTPQNETNDITKEKTDKMENEEKNVVLKALDIIKTTLGLTKTETPAEENSEETPVEKSEGEATELPKEDEQPAEEKPAEEETPVVKSEEVEDGSNEDLEKASKVIAEEEEKDEEIDDEEDAKEDLAEAEAKKKLAEEAKKKENEIKKTSEEDVEAIIQKNKSLEEELEALKKSQAEKEIEIEKMAFLQKAKDEFSMLSGTPEEIGEKLYAISKSNLDDASKTFILESLKKVSDKNTEMTKEIGSITKSADGVSEEDKIYKQAEEIAKSKGISVNKALRQISSEQKK